MAYNVNNEPLYASEMITTLWGRRIGLDINNFLVGPPELRKKVQTISSTSPNTAVPAHGVTRITGLTSTQGPVQHTLDAPIIGVEKTLTLGCTSTASIQFGTTANGASIVKTSDGTTGGWINLQGPGGSITLIGVTTAQWAVKAAPNYSSTALATNVSFTTST